MIPPLFLEIQPNDFVLDMCAAPGSKTTQILELLGRQGQGACIANELDYKRSWILSHSIKKIKTNKGCVINHPGQFIPNLRKENGELLQFDKILVDAPCSGDGAIRKLADRWNWFNPIDGNNLHYV